ncbi:MAG: hypothetical protein Q9187_001291, partial [Circinaria calcarea]
PAVTGGSSKDLGTIFVQFQIPQMETAKFPAKESLPGRISQDDLSLMLRGNQQSKPLPGKIHQHHSEVDVEALLEKKALSEAVYKNVSRRIEGIQSRQASLESRYPAMVNAERIIPLTKTMDEHKAIMDEVNDILERLRKQNESQFYTPRPVNDYDEFQNDKGFRGSPTFDATNWSNRDELVYGVPGNQGGVGLRYGNEHYQTARSRRNTRMHWGFNNYGTRKCRDWIYRGHAHNTGVAAYCQSRVTGGRIYGGGTFGEQGVTHTSKKLLNQTVEMSQIGQHEESLAGQQHTPMQRNASLQRHVAVHRADPGSSHLNRRASIARVRGHVHRPSRLRDCITLDTPSRLRDIVATEPALENDSSTASNPPHLDVPNSTPRNERPDSGDSNIEANTPRVVQTEQNPRSVKNITCHWWATKVCRYTEDECLYAHSIQKTIAEQPRKLDPNGPPVAGRNAHSSRPVHRDWRSAHQLPRPANNLEAALPIQQPEVQRSSQQQVSDLAEKIETEIEEMKKKRGISESVIADICNKVDSELRYGRGLQQQLGYFEAVPQTEIIMNWVFAANDIVRQHRIIIDSINEELGAMGKL